MSCVWHYGGRLAKITPIPQRNSQLTSILVQAPVLEVQALKTHCS